MRTSPNSIGDGDKVTLTITSSDDGTCIDYIEVVAPDGVTTWRYDYAETICVDIISGALITAIRLNNTETDAKVFGPGGDFGDTTMDGGYRAYAVGVDGWGYFDSRDDFVVNGLLYSLAPVSAINLIGDSHTVTVTVSDRFGNPQEGINVRFFVYSGPNTGVNGTNTTDTYGEATFTYEGTGGVGEDTIFGCFTYNSGQEVCWGDPVFSTWIASTTTTTLTTPTSTTTTTTTTVTSSNNSTTTITTTVLPIPEFGEFEGTSPVFLAISFASTLLVLTIISKKKNK